MFLFKRSIEETTDTLPDFWDPTRIPEIYLL